MRTIERSVSRTGRPTAISQALRVLRDGVPPEPATDPFGMVMSPESIRFGDRGTYRMKLARGTWERLRAWRLVYQCYLRKGYVEPRSDELLFGEHEMLPDSLTFICDRSREAVASLTLVFDSPLRLPADDLYREELNGFRQSGRKLCELVGLVNAESGTKSVEVVLHLFKLAYLAARGKDRATDFVITVNPRHVPYYRRTLLFEVAGEERPCPKVCGAPAVLMRLDLLAAEESYRQRYQKLKGPRDLHRFFLHRSEEIASWLEARITRRDETPPGSREPRPSFEERLHAHG